MSTIPGGSPNHDSRQGEMPHLVILHYTGMPSITAARQRLCDPDTKVSCHYLISESGEVHQLVAEERRAWHAGVAQWAGRADVNARSIGIELAHPGHGTNAPVYPDAQLKSLEQLLRDIVDRWSISPQGVLGHSDVSPNRKRDPGEWFPWSQLAAAGLAVWCEGATHEPMRLVAESTHIQQLQSALANIGYGVDRTGRWDAATRAAFRAFQRRFRPREVGVPCCAAGVAHVEEVSGRWPGLGANC